MIADSFEWCSSSPVLESRRYLKSQPDGHQEKFGSFEVGVIRTRLDICGSRWVLFGSVTRWCQNDWFMCGGLQLRLWDLRRFVWLDRVQQRRVHAAAAHRGGS